MERVCTHCGLYFGSFKSEQKSQPKLQVKIPVKNSDKQNKQPMKKVQPQSLEAYHQKELLCAMAFQELKWHFIDYFDFDGVENDISEITHGPVTLVPDNIGPV